MARLFVYGTLKQTFCAHDLLGDSQFLGVCRTASHYHLYHQRWFPAMRAGGPDGLGVCGELYEIDESILDRVDEYEGVDGGLFRRTDIELEDGSTAMAYVYDGAPGTKIESGIWV